MVTIWIQFVINKKEQSVNSLFEENFFIKNILNVSIRILIRFFFVFLYFFAGTWSSTKQRLYWTKLNEIVEELWGGRNFFFGFLWFLAKAFVSDSFLNPCKVINDFGVDSGVIWSCTASSPWNDTCKKKRFYWWG